MAMHTRYYTIMLHSPLLESELLLYRRDYSQSSSANKVTFATIRRAVQTSHMIRITRIRYGFWRFLSDTAVVRFDTGFNKIDEENIFNHIVPCIRHKTILHNGIIVYC